MDLFINKNAKLDNPVASEDPTKTLDYTFRK